ncbi:MAG: hypothetical protein KI785_00525 [Devosiaceae bacterium]|nr:hypothetical protein [Devosiaceae bacterium MH13]
MHDPIGEGPLKALLHHQAVLRQIDDGRRASAAAFDGLKREGLVGGTRALPTITARGRALLEARLTVRHKGAGEAMRALEVPDVIARLAQPRGREMPLLSPSEVEAARRFTRDLRRGGVSPKLTQSWSASALTQKSAPGGRRDEPADAQLDAQARAREACRAVGPDFSGLLIDLCLFEKSVTEMEQERGWPQRSGKLAIALGLRALSRHYKLA